MDAIYRQLQVKVDFIDLDNIWSRKNNGVISRYFDTKKEALKHKKQMEKFNKKEHLRFTNIRIWNAL